MTYNNFKICYIANSRFPSERAHMTQIVHMCNAFGKAGASITLLVTDRRTTITESPETYFGVPLKFEIIRLPVPDIAGRAPYIPQLLRPFLFSLQRLVFAYQTWRHLKKRGYTHLYGRDEWILWLVSLWVHIPIIWESHEARYSFAARRLFKKLKKCIVISEGIKDFYITQRIDPEKLVVAHDAVDERFFESHISTEEARKHLQIITEKPVVMYIGGLEKWKGAQIFFEASKNQSLYDTYVVGGKDEEVISYRTVYPHVHFLGQRPYKELSQNQQAADVLVIPNTGTQKISSQYTSPLKLFAYMTSLKPLVAAKIPSIENILSSDEAFFFSADDPRALHETITRALIEKDRAREMAKNAYTKSSTYTWSNRAVDILSSL